MLSLSTAALAILPALAVAQDTVVFEGRVASDAKLADFDASSSAYDPAYDLGEGMFLGVG
jgi:hypothetical protein